MSFHIGSFRNYHWSDKPYLSMIHFCRVLVIFKSGLLILWGIQESQVLAVCGNVIVAYQRESQTSNLLQNRDNEEDKQISSACWASSNGSRIAIGYTDGDIWLWSVPTTSKLKYNSDAKGLESQDSQCSPISKVQLSNRKAKVPIFSLKWHPGSDIWGCLYVYGGVDFDSSHMIRVWLYS
jgi:syntaxin-binding protein 5